MLGAKDVVGGPNFLQFAIRGSKTAHKIRIELDPSDTYTIRFYRRAGRFEMKEVASFSDVYSDQLHSIIEKHTGLYTSL
jgi:hypothetical protein